MGKRTEFLYLSEQDLLKAGVLDSKRCVDVLDEMFQLMGQGDYIMGGPRANEHGIRMSFPKEPQFEGMPADGPDRRFMAMVAYLGGRFHVAGEKWYGSNIVNPSRGLPRSVLMVMLNDVDTCEPIALMSGNLISSIRTGSVPGVAVRYLAKKESRTCAVIGAGPVNKACVQGIMVDAANVDTITIYDVFPETAEKFAKWVEETYQVKAVVAESTEAAVSDADIISVAASRLKPVIIEDAWLKPGSTLILTGVAQVAERYWNDATIVFDNNKLHMANMEDAHRCDTDPREAYKTMMNGVLYQMVEDGKLPALETMPSLGDIACGKLPGRTDDKQRIAVVTGGMATEDVAWAYDLYLRAKEMGLGQKLLLWDEPHWS